MNWVWLGVNLFLIILVIMSGDLGSFVSDLGKESHLSTAGSTAVLITPFIMVVYLKKYEFYLLKYLLIILNLVALVYSGESFVKYFEPSTNAMWLIAVFLPFIWFSGASENLWRLLKLPLTRK